MTAPLGILMDPGAFHRQALHGPLGGEHDAPYPTIANPSAMHAEGDPERSRREADHLQLYGQPELTARRWLQVPEALIEVDHLAVLPRQKEVGRPHQAFSLHRIEEGDELRVAQALARCS